MSLRRERRAAGIVLAAVFLLFLTYSLNTPLFEASDELWHYPLVQHIATTGNLPAQHPNQTDAEAPWRQEGSQPPLYYVVAALASAPFDSSNWRDLRRINPHGDLGRPTTDGNLNAVVHTEAEQFPWTGAALAIHVARLVSIVFSTVTVLFAYLMARELFPLSSAKSAHDDRAWLRLGVMILTACVPMFAFISGSVNNDNAAAMFATLGLWVALRLARHGELSVKTAVIAGAVTACAALSKSSTLGLLGVFGLAAIFNGLRQMADDEGYKKGELMRRFVAFVLVMVVTTAVLAGWWFVRNQMLYGDWLGWNAFLDTVGRRDPPASLAQLWSEREGFVWAYWGVFGTLNVVMPHIVYDVLNGVVIVAIAGWIGSGIAAVARKRQAPVTGQSGRAQRYETLTRLAPLVICSVWTTMTFIALLRWTSLTPASQGRLMFPCIAVISAAIAYGCYRVHKLVLGAVVVGFALLAIVVPFTVIAPVYAKPLAQAQPAHLLNNTFGGALDLIGYEFPTESVTPGATASLKLFWRVTSPLARNYSVYVHLLNQDNVIVGQRDMYPGQGSLATSDLSSGTAWQDHYDVIISPLAPAPQKLHWAVGVYDLASGERLPITAGAATEQGVEFGNVAMTPATNAIKKLLDYGNGIVLQSYDVSPRTLQSGQPVTVTLQWRADTKVGEDYVVSLQLIDEKTNKIAQNDSAPVDGNAPTSSWKAGQHIDDAHMLQVSKNAPPGVYRLLLVLYQPGSFARIGAYGADGIYLGSEISLMQIRVK